MGRKNKTYQKSLRQQAFERLTAMQAFGESKKAAKSIGTEKGKIFSYDTYRTYWKHTKYFLHWISETHPECTTLKSAKKYVNEWLARRSEQTNASGQRLSAWTLQTEAAALNKLYGIDKADPNRFCPPRRKREDIRRSRGKAQRDRHFSNTKNDELIRFCRGTGCRRNVLERLEGRDLWTRSRMENALQELQKRKQLDKKESLHYDALKTALEAFPDQNHFLHHRKDKNGKYRFAPIIGPDREQIIARMQQIGAHEKVWKNVSSNADIHAYRADYAAEVYRLYARPLSEIPYDKVNRGSKHRYQQDVYVCRNDKRGNRLDRAAMRICSKALGHNRESVVAESYLHGL